ncbi:hypothetical protein P153DRAFT_399328 [Dothidotthia symphoricarpi CBS 119687]|uniref:DNA (cytosine-5)-methyltransferase 1 replication foci domain-containing protein n=1 Tax=Dothidotthia symphoricarpi CBS 119687 TaxID=1392245 RepID=A0A6A6A6Z9_9PLEO|nr:uncharacterized protein P153DRAFT_399328 [Dothidotthia symphoricarpi CBS 119687]KAF2126558.1 hypothetical protein P153DRAFT_399328 [Dothidotthia symphoricarpi CBS 119687]
MLVPEADVLLPLDPSITDSDLWEIFVLRDAHVVYESNGKPASLLAAYADTPLRVEGRLEAPGRAQLKYLVNKPYKPVDIQIRNVTKFSYGETTDGEYVIWAQGAAGWFEIQPTAQYKPIYEDMREAVQLLYFVTDIYNEPRKKGGGPNAQLIYKEYAEDDRFPCTDPADAEKIFNKHRIFLTMCFLNRAQGVGWSNTPIYQQFRRQYPKDFDTCKARKEGRYSQIQVEKQAQAQKSKSSSAPVSKCTESSRDSRQGRGKTATRRTEEAPKKDDNWWEAAALFEFMQKAVNHRALRPGHNHITLEKVAQLIVKRYEIEELEVAQSVLLVHARNLCWMMDNPRRKSVRFFADEPIYQELAAGHDLSAAEQRRAEGVELRPRRDHGTLKEEESESSDTSDEEQDLLATPARRPPGRRKKGRLSVLRPTSAKFTGKSKAKIMPGGKRRGKKPVLESDPSDDESSSSSADQSETAAETDSNTPTQILSPSRDKRKLDETDTTSDPHPDRRKRTTSTSLTLSSPPPTTATSSDSDSDADTNDPNAPIPLRHRPTPTQNTSPPLTAPLVSTPLPTYTPNAPRDSWLCTFDGCAQRIYGCSKDVGRRLITEHMEDHAKGREKVVGVLWREQERLRLPVSNLIKKIREMSEGGTGVGLFPASEEEKGREREVPPRPVQRSV